MQNSDNIHEPVTKQITTKTCCCVRRLNSETRVKQFEDVINRLPISEYYQRLLLARFLTQVEYFEKWTFVANCRYNACRIVIGIGSMTLPSIQSIQSSENIRGYETELFWISVVLSILVLIANSFIGLFSLDHKYHQYKSTLEKLNSAGWIYFELSGKYQLLGMDHQSGIVEFFNEIETIKRMMYQNEDKVNTSQSANDSLPVSVTPSANQVYDEIQFKTLSTKLKKEPRKKNATRIDNGSIAEQVQNLTPISKVQISKHNFTTSALMAKDDNPHALMTHDDHPNALMAQDDHPNALMAQDDHPNDLITLDHVSKSESVTINEDNNRN